MIDVSILTYWGVPNYGAWTQAYALTAYLNSLKKVSAKQVAYIEQSHDDLYYKNDLRLKNSFSYSWNSIPHINIESEEELERRKYDVLITGADSIWSFEGNSVNKDLHLMGVGIDAKKKISYAPSADRLSIDELSEEMVRGISSYDCLSVRDEYTKKILQEAGVDKKIEVVIDPALLWDFTIDEKIVYPLYSDYIAVYGSQWEERFIKYVEDYAERNHLKLISLGYKNAWCDFSIKMNELRAVEWIGFIGKSSLVITSTFHGLMVGLNYGKKVIFNQVNSVANRSETLKKELNAKTLEIPGAFEFQKSEYAKRLEFLRRKAVDYIEKALLDENDRM